MSKKGQFADMITTIVMILVVAVVVIIAGLGAVRVLGNLADNSVAGTLENDISSDRGSTLPTIFQSIFLILFLGMGLAVLVSAFLVRNYPLLSVVMVILLVFVIIFSSALSNMYFTLAESSDAGAMTERFGAMQFLFTWYPRIIAGLTGLVIILMFAKGGGGQG